MKIREAREFYENLGKAFFAVAAADRVVRKEEKETLQWLVQQKWAGIEKSTDEFGADASFQIETMVDWLETHNLSANEAFEEFHEYRQAHGEYFTESVKELTLKTAEAIADSFLGKNKSELVMLYKLKSILSNSKL